MVQKLGGTVASIFLLLAPCAFAQGVPGDPAAACPSPEAVVPAPPPSEQPKPSRIFGVLPNYRFGEKSGHFQPLTVKQKFHIAWRDSTDWPVFPIALFYTTIYHLENQNPSFGQGVEGFAHRFAAAYADQVIGNTLSEGVIPSVLHHDPRYFRRGEGSIPTRTAYAISRLFVTRTDSGGHTLNVAELGGNAAQVAISNAYYPDSRTWVQNRQRLTLQVGMDGVGNVLKEFWPDIQHKLFGNKQHSPDAK